MLSSIAVMTGSFLTGVLWDSFGSQIPFLISALISLLISVLLLVIKAIEHRSL
jgi:predicted MFS family arabinose efflux permease